MATRGKKVLNPLKHRDVETLNELSIPNNESKKSLISIKRRKDIRFAAFKASTRLMNTGTARVRFKEDGLVLNCPLSHIKERKVLKVSDTRLVKWKDGNFYKATITNIGKDGVVNVTYVADKVKHQVTLDQIDKATTLHKGDVRDVRWKDGRYYRATITDIYAEEDTCLKANNTRDSESSPMETVSTHLNTTIIKNEEKDKDEMPTTADENHHLDPGGVIYAEKISCSSVEDRSKDQDRKPENAICSNDCRHVEEGNYTSTTEQYNEPIATGHFPLDKPSSSSSEEDNNQVHSKPESQYSNCHNGGNDSEDKPSATDKFSNGHLINAPLDNFIRSVEDSNHYINLSNSQYGRCDVESENNEDEASIIASDEDDDYMPTTDEDSNDSYSSGNNAAENPSLSSTEHNKSDYCPTDSQYLIGYNDGKKNEECIMATNVGEENSDSNQKNDSNDSQYLRCGNTSENHSDLGENEIHDKTASLAPAKVVVARTTNLANKRNWDKKFPCLFCKRFIGKLPRHYEQVHSNEKEVLVLKSLPKNDPKRKELLDNLRNSALYIHNTTVLKNECGTIIPKRRKLEQLSPSKLVPCVRCNAFLSKTLLHRHKKICTFKRPKNTLFKYKERVADTATYMLPTSSLESYKRLLKTEVIAGMRESPEKNQILSDELIINFGAEMFEKLSHIPERNNHIRNKLRELSRFLLQAKQIQPGIQVLNDLLKPNHFQLVVDATLKVAGFKIESNEFETPTLAKKIGESLQKCIAISNKNAILEKDEEKRKEIKDFIELFDADWNRKVSNKALATLYKAKFNKQKPLPLSDDTTKLANFLQKERQICIEAIARDVNAASYSNLLKITLACLIIFNKKRVGDAHNLLVASYMEGANNCQVNNNIMKHLNETERDLINSLTRIETRGKRSKKVPILLTPQLKEMTELLLKNRLQAGVMPENNKFFAIPGTRSSYYRGSDIIRDIRTRANLKHPDRITSTNLRKEAATMAAASGCSDSEIDILATFMGHDRATHQKYYRLPDDTLQKAKVGNFLLNVINYGNKPSTSNQAEESRDPVVSEDMNTNETSNTRETSSQATRPLPTKRKTAKPRIPWRNKQKEILKKVMEKHFVMKTLPGKTECESVLKKYGHLFQDRLWTDIKFFVKNNIHKPDV